MSSAAQQWADGLAAWAVPQEILDAAPQRPFVFNPAMFAARSLSPERVSLWWDVAERY